MILVDNISIIKNISLPIWEKLKIYEENENRKLFLLEESKSGFNTLAIKKDNKKVYLHSRYNPIREAEAITEPFRDLGENTKIIFYGTGLGYHIQLLLESLPNAKYFIYEPIPELLHSFLSTVNLSNLKPNRLLGISMELNDLQDKVIEFVSVEGDKLKIIDLPSHSQNFQNEYNDFYNTLKSAYRKKRKNLNTNYSFQKRWIINSMVNFKEVLSTPNILIEKKGEFKNKPAILVAAGPSLNDEIENIKYIKEKGLAYIFSVGSAINTLIYHNIYPDAATSYDPTIENQKVFKKVKDQKINDIPIIFGTSVGFETLQNYPGKKYHMTTSQDTVSNFYLKDADRMKLNIVNDAPSIAVVTLQLLYYLGFNPIILVGQNLAFRGKERHSEGISYSKALTDREINKGIWVKNVYGDEVLTNETFESMRRQMELYIKGMPEIQVINTTKDGAHIEGTEFVELKEIIIKELKERAVEKGWLECNKTNYDKDFLVNQMNKMDKELRAVFKICKEFPNILAKIDKLLNNRNYSQVEKMYNKLDEEFHKIEGNHFFKTFILPMNRVEYKLLGKTMTSLKEEKDPIKRAKTIIHHYRNFITICIRDMEMITPIYNSLNEAITRFALNEVQKG